MKVRSIVLICVLIITAGLYYLFADEDLNPEIIAIQQEYAKPEDLDKNVYIEMMSWQYLGTDNAYELAVNAYEKKIAELNFYSVRDISPIQYPQVKFLHTEEHLLYCDLSEESCITTIIKQKDYLEKLVSDNQDLLYRFYKLAEFDNFSPLNPLLIKGDFDFTVLYRIAALDIIFKLESEKINQAEKSISQLITIDRKFMATTNEFLLKLISISNFSQIHLPLVAQLAQKKRASNLQLLKIIKPLTIEEISFSEIWRSELHYTISLLKTEEVFSKVDGFSNSQNKIMKSFMFKEHMTFNDISDFYLTKIIPRTQSKSQYIRDIKSVNNAVAEFHDENKSYLKCSFCGVVVNLNNILGHFITVTAMPKYNGAFDREVVKVDIKLQLLRLKLSSLNSVAESVLSKKQWQEPYLQTQPFIKDDMICYHVEEDVCVRH